MSVGNAVLAIVDGASAADAAVLGFKVGAAGYFTAKEATEVANGTLSANDPSIPFIAQMAVAPVVSFATEAELAWAPWPNFGGTPIDPPPAPPEPTTYLPPLPAARDALLLGS